MKKDLMGVKIDIMSYYELTRVEKGVVLPKEKKQNKKPKILIPVGPIGSQRKAFATRRLLEILDSFFPALALLVGDNL